MHDSEKCFVTTIKESVRLIDLPRSVQSPVIPRSQRFQSLDDLNDYINEAANGDYSCRIMWVLSGRQKKKNCADVYV